MSEYGWIDLGNGRQVYRRLTDHHEPARATLPCPMLALDTMDPTQHPADGQHYTSKAKFREVTRANQMVEVGNDPARFRHQNPTKPDRASIRQSLEKAMAQVNTR